MNDEDLRLLAQRGSVYRLDGRQRSRRLAVWLLALALAGMAALWFLLPSEGAVLVQGRDSSLECRMEQVQDGAAQNDTIKLAAPVGPDGPGPACLVEQGWVRKACVRPIGREEWRSCQTARTSLMLCRMGK